MAALELYLLGPFQARLGGRPAAGFESNKVRALLAYLAVEASRPRPREVLAGLLWPEQPQSTALSDLRYALSNLRTVIGDRTAVPPFLCIDRQTLQLNPEGDCWLDVDELVAAAEDCGLAAPWTDPERPVRRKARSALQAERLSALKRAAELYRGRFLEGFSLADAPGFEEWALLMREQMDVLMMRCLRHLAGHHAGRAEWEEVLVYSRRQVELEPWDEEAQRQLICALVLNGERGAALAQYESCRRTLAGELGVEPSLATTALYEAIRDENLSQITAAQGGIWSSSVSAAGNLPVSLTSFVGRRDEMAEIERLLAAPVGPDAGAGAPGPSGVRLLTLTGHGGCGKTRLALEAARRFGASGCFRNGIRWVDLSGLSDPDLVPQAVAAVLGVQATTQLPTAAVLTGYLRRKECLLVLDTCEHLADGCARLAETLLAACPALRILATSRQPLGLPGEVVRSITGLVLPGRGELAPDRLLASDAVRLFVERAGATAADWGWPRNAAAVARICTRLDGIPLALELAAARLKVLSAEQIAARLGDRLDLLVDGRHSAAPRHRTLRAAVDWSYDLLTAEEKAALERLSVFAAGCTLEAAQAVVVPPPDSGASDRGAAAWHVLDLLTRLADRSLLVVEMGQDARYRLPETIRQYAAEKLALSGEAAATRRRHLRYSLRWAEQGDLELRGPEQKAYLAGFDLESDNLRAALAFGLDEGETPEDLLAGARLAGALWWWWRLRGSFHEGLQWLHKAQTRLDALAEPLREEPEALQARAQVLLGAGSIVTDQGDLPRAEALLEESVRVWGLLGPTGRLGRVRAQVTLGRVAGRRHDRATIAPLVEAIATLGIPALQAAGDEWGLAYAHVGLAMAMLKAGDVAGAESTFRQAAVRFRQVGDEWGLAVTMINLGEFWRSQGDWARTAEHFEQALAYGRSLGLAEPAWLRANLALALIHLGDLPAARQHLAEALVRSQEQGNRASTALCLVGLADCVPAEEAACLLGAAQAITAATGSDFGPGDRQEWERITASVRVRLGEDALSAAWARGEAMSLDEIVACALAAARQSEAGERACECNLQASPRSEPARRWKSTGLTSSVL